MSAPRASGAKRGKAPQPSKQFAELGGVPILLHHDVLGLQIAMHDARAMRGLQSLAHLADDRHGLLRRQLPALANHVLQIRAFDEIHRDEFRCAVLANVENADHVLVDDLLREQHFLF